MFKKGEIKISWKIISDSYLLKEKVNLFCTNYLFKCDTNFKMKIVDIKYIINKK